MKTYFKVVDYGFRMSVCCVRGGRLYSVPLSFNGFIPSDIAPQSSDWRIHVG